MNKCVNSDYAIFDKILVIYDPVLAVLFTAMMSRYYHHKRWLKTLEEKSLQNEGPDINGKDLISGLDLSFLNCEVED